MNDLSDQRTPSKIVSLEKLATCLDARRAQEKIVLCHGAFDLFHIGHLRHLSAARKFGNLLVVTITADEFINKAPDRPVFTGNLRAEMLAALEIVDYVAIVNDPSATPVIEAVKPDFYVKGGEYQEAKEDITGKIVAEQALVEKFGGQLVFTHEETYSSSNLLNHHSGAVDGPARAYLDQKQGAEIADRISGYIDRLSTMRVVIVGESIIDQYVYVDAMGKAAKENIIATIRRSEEVFAGGAVAAAGHIASLCGRVELITLVGNDQDHENYEDLIISSLPDSVDVNFVRRDIGPTVLKTRFVEPTHLRKLFEVYDMNDQPLASEVQEHLHTILREKCRDVDLVIVCDFGHGMISAETAALIEGLPAFLAVNTQSNAGNIGFNLASKYNRADFFCIDTLEARLAAHDKHSSVETIVKRLKNEILDCSNLIVTSGKRGCYIVDGSGAEAIHIPSFERKIVDTLGAGDAFFVISSLFSGAGADCETAGIMGNVAGAIKIGIVGHRRYLERLEIQQFVISLLK